MTVCNQNRIKCSKLETRMEECSNGTNCSSLTQLETIWNMTQCGRKVSSGSTASEGSAASSEEDSSQLSSSETTATAASSAKDSISGRGGRKKRGVFGSSSNRTSFGSSRSQPANVDAEYEFLAIFMGLPEVERMAIGHDFDGMFKGCTFEGVDCLDKR